MGWVVYDARRGHMQKYYKLASTARRIVTQHNTPRDHGDWVYTPSSKWACFSYRDYEGVLMGLIGDALNMLQYCNTQTG